VRLVVAWLACTALAHTAVGEPQPESGELPIWSTVNEPPVICYPGERHAHVVTIPGEMFPESVVIEDISSSCSCIDTAPPPSGTVHAQATPLPVHVRIDARDPRAQAPFNVWVIANRGGSMGAIQVALRTEVRDYFTWPNPDAVWRASPVDAGSAAEQTWQIGRGTHPATWDRMSVTVLGDAPIVSATIALGPEGTWTTRTRWALGHWMGVMAATLEWRVWSGAVELPYRPQRGLRMEVRGPVLAVPAMVVLGGMRPGESRSVSVDLATRTGGDLPEVVRIEMPDEDGIRAALGAPVGGRRELTLTCTAATTPRRYDKAVLVHLADGGVLRIPYLGRVYP
jgi:hypothetical protein